MDAEEKKRTPEVPASPSAPAPAQQPAAPAPSGGAFSNITPVQLDAAARAAAKQDVDRTLELADGLDIQLNDKFKSYDDDRKAALQYVTAAGIAFEHSLANAAGAPDLASRERVSLAADELGRRWAEYNGLADYRGADVVLDRNGQVHVRFNVGGKWTDDPEFGIERGPDGFPRKTGAQPFDYGKMHDYMTENGYLGQLGDADLEDAGKAAAEAAAATAAPDKPWADESAFYKAGEAIPEWQRGAWYEKNAPVMFGDEEGKAIAARYAEYAKSKQSGGKPGNSVDALLSGAVPPPAEGKGGETPASGVDLNAVSKGAPAPEGGNPPAPGEPPASNALRKEGDNPEQTMQPLDNSDLQETDPLAAAFAAKPGETAASKPAAEARADKAKARREAGAAAAARMNAKPEEKSGIALSASPLEREKQIKEYARKFAKDGWEFKLINGEYYARHKDVNGNDSWVSGDGSAVKVENGSIVNAGNPRMEREERLYKATGPGGQGDLRESGVSKRTEAVPKEIFGLLRAMNDNDEAANSEAELRAGSGRRRDVYVEDETGMKKGRDGGLVRDLESEQGPQRKTGSFVKETQEGPTLTKAHEARLEAFERGPTAVAQTFNNLDRIHEKSVVKDADGNTDLAETTKAERKNLEAALEAFDKLSPADQRKALDQMGEFGRAQLSAARNLRRVDKAIKAITEKDLQSWDDLSDAVEEARKAMEIDPTKPGAAEETAAWKALASKDPQIGGSVGEAKDRADWKAKLDALDKRIKAAKKEWAEAPKRAGDKAAAAAVAKMRKEALDLLEQTKPNTPKIPKRR